MCRPYFPPKPTACEAWSFGRVSSREMIAYLGIDLFGCGVIPTGPNRWRLQVWPHNMDPRRIRSRPGVQNHTPLFFSLITSALYCVIGPETCISDDGALLVAPRVTVLSFP